MKMKRTRRLTELYGELEACRLFADVGCDHGYCTQYMLENDLCRCAQISDISAKSLQKAEALLSAYINAGRVRAVVCAGLEKIDPNTDLVLIAGMGGEEIVGILRDGFLPPKVVLQPMKNSDKVRRFLLQEGYGILRDNTFFADGKFYDLIRAVRGSACGTYTADMIMFGRDNLLNPREDFRKKLERDIAQHAAWMENAREGREEIVRRLSKLKEIYDETCRRLSSN